MYGSTAIDFAFKTCLNINQPFSFKGESKWLIYNCCIKNRTKRDSDSSPMHCCGVECISTVFVTNCKIYANCVAYACGTNHGHRLW